MSDLNNSSNDYTNNDYTNNDQQQNLDRDAIDQQPNSDLDTAPDQTLRATADVDPSQAAQAPRRNQPDTQQTLDPVATTQSPAAHGSPSAPMIGISQPSIDNRVVSASEVEWQIRRISRRSFLNGAAGVAAGFIGWRWLIGQYLDNGIPWPFRRALEVNEGLARSYFQDSRLAPTFARGQAAEPRPNGEEGLPDDFDPDAWKLHVTGLEGDAATLTLSALKALPRVEMVTELKCIEGWSTIVHWAGARFADFIAKYPPAKDDDHHLPQYVALETPDGGYYVGLDMASAMHPQTLLCYEMNGEPLTAEHGAPLRLAIPVKYGIKNIKRIGSIHYTNERPKDYWAERGYDWYAGH